MAEAHAEEGSLQLGHPTLDDLLFARKPRVDVLLPDLLGAPHGDHEVEGLEGGDGFTRVELDRGESQAGAFQQGAERARVLVWVVLEDENSSRAAR